MHAKQRVISVSKFFTKSLHLSVTLNALLAGDDSFRRSWHNADGKLQWRAESATIEAHAKVEFALL